MPLRNWTRTDNFFKSAASRSYISAKGIFNSLDAKLLGGIADPAILDFYTSFHSLNTEYNAKYAIWDGLRSTGIGKTLGVVQLLDLLSSTKIKGWDIAIQTIYVNTSTQYVNLLPHHRTPFQNGTVDKRVAALTNLISAIGTDASLAVVKTGIISFLALLQAAITAQSSQITGIDTAILNLETASNNASDEAFGIYGGFVTKFKKTPKSIDMYMPIALLQYVMQVSFTATLKNLLPKKLFKRKIDITKQTLKGMNVGMFDVIGYFGNGITNTLPVDGLFITLPANSSAEYAAEDAGYTDTNRHFYIKNTGNTDAAVEIDIMMIN